MDDIEARNRAMIEQGLQRPVGTNPVTNDDVVAMTQAGLSDEIIVTHIRSHGVARPPQAADLILLQQQRVSPAVIRAMQEPPMVAQRPVLVQPAPAPVIVEEYYYQPWPYYRPYRCPPPPPRVGVGVAFHN
jgi:hypothetical protein